MGTVRVGPTMPGMDDIKGLGPAKVAKLQAAGVHDLQDLATVDLRRPHGIGISNEVLKDAKRQARQILDKEGIPYAKAPYRDAPAGPAQRAVPAGNAPRTSPAPPRTPPASDDRPDERRAHAPRRGFLARLFRRD